MEPQVKVWLGYGSRGLDLLTPGGILAIYYVTLLYDCLYTVYYTAVYVTIYGENVISPTRLWFKIRNINLIKTFWGETKTALRHVSTRPELTVRKSSAPVGRQRAAVPENYKSAVRKWTRFIPVVSKWETL